MHHILLWGFFLLQNFPCGKEKSDIVEMCSPDNLCQLLEVCKDNDLGGKSDKDFATIWTWLVIFRANSECGILISCANERKISNQWKYISFLTLISPPDKKRQATSHIQATAHINVRVSVVKIHVSTSAAGLHTCSRKKETPSIYFHITVLRSLFNSLYISPCYTWIPESHFTPWYAF